MPPRTETPATGVHRTLNILEMLATERQGLTNSEISRRLRIPKSSASYLLRALEGRGYLRRERGSGRYHLGLKVLYLNRAVLTGLGLHELSLPHLHWLVERSQLAAHVAVLDHGQAVYVEKVDSPGFIKMDTWVGRHMDVHATSVGKALVAFLPRPEVEAILHQHGLRKRTPKTIITVGKLFRELEKVRTCGYAVDDEENSPGVCCVAAPVFGSLGEVQAALGVSGATSQLNRATLPRVAAQVREAARRLSRQLGYRGAGPTR